MNNRPLSVTEYSSFLANKITPHNCMCRIDYDGVIDDHILAMALKTCMDVHPALNFCVEKKPLSLSKKKSVIVVNKLEAKTKDELLIQYEREANTPFNLEISPLIRITLAQFEDTKQLWIVINHIICDGISLANFPSLLFQLIDEISVGKNEERSIGYGFENLDDLMSFRQVEEYQDNRTSLFLSPLHTKSMMFSSPMFKKNSHNINTNILAASGIAVCNLANIDVDLNYCIPVNIRPYVGGNISNNQLGFYSSWIDFNYTLNRKNKLTSILNELSHLVSDSILTGKQISNIQNLMNTIGTSQQAGILDNIQKSNEYSMCISNVGRINMESSYDRSNIKIKAIYLGLNSYYRKENCFLLIATGFSDRIFFTLQYNEAYMKSESADKFVKEFLKLLPITMNS